MSMKQEKPALDSSGVFRYADTDARFGAFIIDWHIRTMPIALWGFWVFFKWFPVYWQAAQAGRTGFALAWQTATPIMSQPGISSIGWLCVVAYFLYHPVCELLMHGNSPGKHWMSIKVVSLNGNPPDARQILIRNLWRAVEFLPVAYLWGVIAILRSPENARPGDISAGTRVVNAR